MSNPEKQAKFDELTNELSRIATYDISSLTNREEHGILSFKQDEMPLAESVELAREALDVAWLSLPHKTILEAIQPAKACGNGLVNVANFSVTAGNAASARAGIVSSMRECYERLLSVMIQVLPYSSLKTRSHEPLMAEARQLLETSKAEIAQARHKIEEQVEAMSAAVLSAQTAAGDVGISRFETHFGELLEEHRRASFWWLLVTGILLLLAVAAGGLFLLMTLWDSEPEHVQQVVAKALVISLLYVSAIWSSRNYKAHRHLAVVNGHRQTALATFQAFASAAGDDDIQTKNAVLMAATRCIFAPSATGYVGADSETSGSRAVEIMNTVKGVTGTGMHS